MYMERIDRLWNTNDHTHVIEHQLKTPNLLNGMGIVEYKGLEMYIIIAIVHTYVYNIMQVCTMCSIVEYKDYRNVITAIDNLTIYMYVPCVFTYKGTHTHARTHTRTHARTHTQHTHTHLHTYSLHSDNCAFSKGSFTVFIQTDESTHTYL